jgi:TonB family protein
MPSRFRRPLSWKVIAVCALWAFVLSTAAIVPRNALAQEELTRKVKTKVEPYYPDLARRMSIHGMVKLVVVVAPNGSPKDMKVVGGNPLLVNAALDAVKQWKFEPARDESTVTLEFNFRPN